VVCRDTNGELLRAFALLRRISAIAAAPVRRKLDGPRGEPVYPGFGEYSANFGDARCVCGDAGELYCSRANAILGTFGEVFNALCDVGGGVARESIFASPGRNVAAICPHVWMAFRVLGLTMDPSSSLGRDGWSQVVRRVAVARDQRAVRLRARAQCWHIRTVSVVAHAIIHDRCRARKCIARSHVSSATRPRQIQRTSAEDQGSAPTQDLQEEAACGVIKAQKSSDK